MNDSFKVDRFTLNNSLAYAIQQVTKDPSEEIIGYFYGVATFVAQDVFRKCKSYYTNKDIVLFYKDTPIAFKIKLHCSGIQSDDKKVVHVNVCFPSQTQDQDITDLMNKVVENGLGLIEDEEMPVFNRPLLKTPKCLKDVRIKQNESRE